jgi:hypothetical protein
MERVAELLQARKWVKKCLRTNITDNVTGNKVKVAHVASNVLNREKEPELYEAIRAIAPEWWEETRIHAEQGRGGEATPGREQGTQLDDLAGRLRGRRGAALRRWAGDLREGDVA